MTDEQIAALGPAFAAELRRYRDCLGQDRTARHFDNYCRGLLSDLPRKSVEPIALASGTAVRTLQEFLVTSTWDHVAARDRFQRRMADALAERPSDPLGTVGVIDETSAAKKGDRTPGVQRQDLGCVGKIDNGIVTVHVGVAKGRFQALLDAEPYLPASWAADRERCRDAGIPDDVRFRSKWRIALDQLIRLRANGVTFDWLTFDEGSGSKPPFLSVWSGT
jgi:SRSO17 transposase